MSVILEVFSTALSLPLFNWCQAYILFGDEEYLFIFQEAYRAAMLYLYNDPWLVNSLAISS